VEDPLLYDTKLTNEGQLQALKLNKKLMTGPAPGAAAAALTRPDLIVVSPLTRALHTAQLAFAGYEDVPR
jgi:broad specificity phosphatase PhoE